jgi:antitoxin component YwqK of YwqJK toxin-antitoxin module
MPNKPTWHLCLLGVVAAAALAFTTWAERSLRLPAVTALRSELDLREGVLFRRGESQPFSGLLISEWKRGVRRTEVSIRDGRAHGVSRGWFEHGQLEVRENFVRGVSDGLRTRWFADGTKRSEVRVRRGELVGVFREWHPNGQLARETPLANGKPHGLVRGWDPQGKLAGTAVVQNGERVPGQ